MNFGKIFKMHDAGLVGPTCMLFFTYSAIGYALRYPVFCPVFPAGDGCKHSILKNGLKGALCPLFRISPFKECRRVGAIHSQRLVR